MTEGKRIEKLKEEIQRLREKSGSLQDENAALKTALDDKDKTIAELEKELDSRAELWEKHLTDVAEAIEEAAEARLGYEQARDAAEALRSELSAALRAIRKRLT